MDLVENFLRNFFWMEVLYGFGRKYSSGLNGGLIWIWQKILEWLAALLQIVTSQIFYTLTGILQPFLQTVTICCLAKYLYSSSSAARLLTTVTHCYMCNSV